MKTTLKYLTIMGLAIAALTWPSFTVSGQGDTGQRIEDVGAREAYRRLQLQDENGQIPLDGWSNAYRQKDAMPFLPEAWSEFSSAAQIEAGLAGGVWTSIGPGNIGGRIRSIVIHPIAYPRIMWAGAVAGGIWKTTNGGITWSTNTDSLANLAVNCIAIDPANPLILYAGTGEGFGNIDAVPGNGIFKTIDGGNNWVRLYSLDYIGNPNYMWINRLAISPNNSQLILAVTRFYQDGQAVGKILRSTNGGASWTISAALPAPMTDIRFKPISTATPPPGVPLINCLASSQNGHVYYSTDNGATWITNPNNGLAPPASLQRVELAYSHSNALIVYASKGPAEGGSPTAALYQSTDGGYTFSPTGPLPPFVRDHGANWYANVLWVDPTNSQTVLVGGEYLHRSTDGGVTWVEASSISTHPDHHVIAEDPAYPGTGDGDRIVYGGNDGGIFKTMDILASPTPGPSINPPVTWTSLNHALGVTQFYGAAGNPGGTIIGGTQDNGTVQFSEFRQPAPEQWRFMKAKSDAGFCAVDQQTDSPYFYGEYPNLQIYRNRSGGLNPDPNGNGPVESIWGGPGHPNGIPYPLGCHGVPCANYTAPFVLDPNNTQEGVHRMLAGGSSLWRSTNEHDVDDEHQVRWDEIKQPVPASGYINAIAVAEGFSDFIWVGYNDGSVYYTTNGTAGPSPSPTPSWSPGDPNGQLPGGRPPNNVRLCTRITIGQAPDTNHPQIAVARTVYVTFGGFFPSEMDTRGNVWKRENDGVTWTDIHNNLPSTPIYSLVISPSNPDFLYVGTENGVFASANGGATWSPAFGGSSADTIVYSLIVSASSPSSPDIVYVGTAVGAFASADEGATWSPGFGGPANTRVAELFWMPTNGSRKLVVATHGRGMFTLQPASP